MFIELTEILRCPKDHDESYLICGPVTMDGRDVVRGGLVCPVCHAEFPIIDRVAFFAPPAGGAAASGPLTLEAALTFMDLAGAGGYVLTVGEAGRLGPELAGSLRGVAVVGVNPPDTATPSAGFSILRSPGGFPVKQRSVRAALVGSGAARSPWLERAVGAVLPGLRAIIEDERADGAGLIELARGAGVLVGEKRAK